MANPLRVFERTLRRVAREAVGLQRFSRGALSGLGEGERRMVLSGAIRATLAEAGELPSQRDVTRLFSRDVGGLPTSSVAFISRTLRREEGEVIEQLAGPRDQVIGADDAIPVAAKFRRNYVDRVEVTFRRPVAGIGTSMIMSVSTDETMTPEEIEQEGQRLARQLAREKGSPKLRNANPEDIANVRFVGRFKGVEQPF